MGDRAAALYRDLGVAGLTGAARALADEACLILERLEQLDKVLQGDPDAWVKIVERLPDHVAEVVVDKPLAEVRQQGLALKAVLAELTKMTGQEVPVPQADTADELRRRRDQKRATG